MAADRTPFHIQCLKCQECKKKLTPATINEHEHRLYCPTCYEDLFNQKVRNNKQSNILIFIAWLSYLGWCSRKNSYASFTNWRNVHSCKFYLGVTSEKKNRRFKDNRQIGEGGSRSNQKFKMILISDIFWRGGGGLKPLSKF